MALREISLITGNANKLADVKEILEPRGFQVKSQALDIPELQGSIEEITIAKCKRAAELVRVLTGGLNLNPILLTPDGRGYR